MARFLIGGTAAQFESRDKDRAMALYQYERNMQRNREIEAYQREKDREDRKFREEQAKYNQKNINRNFRLQKKNSEYQRMDNDRKFDIYKNNQDLARQIQEFQFQQARENAARAGAERWAQGLNQKEYQRALDIAYGNNTDPSFEQYRRDNPTPNYADLYANDPIVQWNAEDEIGKMALAKLGKRPEWYRYTRIPTLQEATEKTNEIQKLDPYQEEAVRLRRKLELGLNTAERQKIEEENRKFYRDRTKARDDAALRAQLEDLKYDNNRGMAWKAAYQASKAFILPEDNFGVGNSGDAIGLGSGIDLNMIAKAAFELSRKKNIPMEDAAFEIYKGIGFQVKPEYIAAKEQERKKEKSENLIGLNPQLYNK